MIAEASAGRFSEHAEWKAGTARPTMKQLERLAKTVHAPVGCLFLSERAKLRRPPVLASGFPTFAPVSESDS